MSERGEAIGGFFFGCVVMMGAMTIAMMFSDVAVEQPEMELAVSLCESNGGLKYLLVDELTWPDAVCNNDAKIPVKVVVK